MEKIFAAPKWANRKIKVKIDKKEDEILFTFPDENDREFYWITASEWISDYDTTRQGRGDNWHNHMRDKIWFTNEMHNFINENLLTNEQYSHSKEYSNQ